MTIESRWLVYPDGERQETPAALSIGSIVDMNGRILRLPVPDPRTIAYRVGKIRRIEERGSLDVLYYLELIPVADLKRLGPEDL